MKTRLWANRLVPLMILLLGGCASERESVGTGSVSNPAESVLARFGRIAFADNTQPAPYGFQKAKGKLGSAKQAFLDSAEMGLSGPGAGVIAAGTVLTTDFETGGDPYFYGALAGAAGGVAAVGAALAGPVVGTEGLIRSLRKVTPAELAEREAALTKALSHAAEQKHFREAVLQAAAERLGEGIIEEQPTGFADALLETRVDGIRLDRAGSSEGSYFLLINSHARLVRVSDGAMLYEESVSYRSHTALFLDWTMHGAIEAVAETGYQTLAERYIDQLVVCSSVRGR